MEDGWTAVPPTANFPGYSFFSQPIHKPDNDDREYRLLRLENGLVAALVHDGNADKAAACVDVAVGHLQDPDDIPGLAHFCEHMITKGSELFPEENDYLSYIQTNGGARNAGTAAAYQDYWFSINPSALVGGLPRLAAFFRCPLFTANLTSREMHAVDSENKRNLQNDSRRMHQLSKALSAPGHPWAKFGTGNLQSLTEAARKTVQERGENAESEDGDGGPVGREVRRRLMEWWQEQYSAERMSLVVVAKETVDELTQLVVPLFSPINRNGVGPRPQFTEPVWGPDQIGTEVLIKTVKDTHLFSLAWPISDQAPLFRTQPAKFISHFLGHEGPGSICAYLKKKGWLLSISSGYSARNRSVSFFSIEGRLTREGYLHYQDVILTIHAYVSLIRSSTFDSYHFTEMAQMARTTFRFREKGQPHTFARTLGLDLLEPYPPQTLLSRGALEHEWDEGAVRALLNGLTPERARIVVAARDHVDEIVGGEGGATWAKEAWYGTEYIVRKVSGEFLKQASKPNNNSELFLPAPNPYIPQDLSVHKREIVQPAKQPDIVQKTSRMTLWHKPDDQFWVPKAQVRVKIKSAIAYATPRHAVHTRLLVDLLDDALSELTYAATLAGLSYDITHEKAGVYLSVSGYSDKLPLLLRAIVDKLIEFEIKEDRVAVYKEQTERVYRNFYLGQPSELAQYFMSAAISLRVWTPQQKLSELSHVTKDSLQWHKNELLRKVYLDALVTGNITAEQAVEMIDDVEQRLGARTLPPAEWPRERLLVPPTGTDHILQKKHKDPEEKNSALLYYVHFGNVADPRLRAVLTFIVHVIREPAFSQLRTVEQLGYIVAASMWTAPGSMGLGIKMQSLHPPSHLEDRVVAFLTTFRATLAAFTPDEVAQMKSALATRLRERPKNLREEAGQFWFQIDVGYEDFLKDENDADTVEQLTLDEVVVAYDAFVLPGSQTRKKLSVHLVSQQAENVLPEGKVLVRDEATFKAGLQCGPAAVSVNAGKGRDDAKL